MDKVQICSMALQKLGKSAIASLDSSAGEFVVAVSQAYDLLLPFVIGAYDWRFAVKVVTPNQIPGIPAVTQYQYIFQLPSDYLTFIRFYPATNSFQIYGDQIWTNYLNCVMEYRYRPLDEQLPLHFINYFVDELADYLCLSVARDLSYKEIIKKDKALSKAIATAMDAQAHPGYAWTNNPMTRFLW